MGVILNPVAFRVGYKHSWIDAWYTHRFTYSVFLHDVLAIKSLVYFIFFRFFLYKKNYWIYSHLSVVVWNNKTLVYLYLYDGSPVTYYQRISKWMKRVPWRKLLFLSGWLKKRYYDRRPLIKRFHMLTLISRFFYEFMIFEDKNITMGHYETRRLLRSLKRLDYSKNYKDFFKDPNPYKVYFKIIGYKEIETKEKKKRLTNLVYDYILFRKQVKDNDDSKSWWFAWEDTRPYQDSAYFMRKDVNALSFNWWLSRYKKIYNDGIASAIDAENKNIFFVRPFEYRSNFKSLLKTHSRKIRRMNTDFRAYINEDEQYKFLSYVLSNNKIFITFLAFMINFIDKMSLKRQKGVFRARWMRKFLKFFVFFFVKKMILRQYSMFFKMIFSFLNYDFSIKMFVLDNNSVTAAFISRFLAIGLRHNYDYNDMVTPIRRNLKNQMYVKRWSTKTRNIVFDEFIDERFVFLNDFRRFNALCFYKMQAINNYAEYTNESLIFNGNFVSSFLINRVLNLLKKKNFLMQFRSASSFLIRKSMFRYFFRKKRQYKKKKINILKKLSILRIKKFHIIKYIYRCYFFFKINNKFITNNSKFEINLFSNMYNNFIFMLDCNRFKYYRLLKFKRRRLSRFLRRYNRCIKSSKSNKRVIFFLFITRFVRKINILVSRYFLKRRYILRKKLKVLRIRKKIIMRSFKRINKIIEKYKLRKLVVKKRVFKLRSNRRFYKRISLVFKLRLKRMVKFFNFLFRQFFIKRYVYRVFKRLKILRFYKGKVLKYLRSFMYVNNMFYAMIRIVWKRFHGERIVYWGNFYLKWKRRVNLKKIIRFFYYKNVLLKFFANNLRLIGAKVYNYVNVLNVLKYCLKKKKSVRNLVIVAKNYFLLSILNFTSRAINVMSIANLSRFIKSVEIKFFNFFLNKLDGKNFLNQADYVTNVLFVNFFFYYNFDTMFFKRFAFNLYDYKKYLKTLGSFNIDKYSYKMQPEVTKLPLFFFNKEKRLKYLDNNVSILYGYKFHFVGRFTRKQQSANLWYVRGSMPYSAAKAKLDYALYSIIMRYSVCTVKVWLYRSQKSPKYRIRVL